MATKARTDEQKTNKKIHRNNHSVHLNVIAKSIDRILDQTTDYQFGNEVKQTMGIVADSSIQAEILKQLEENYQPTRTKYSKKKMKK